jgi:hypothetical protein
LGGLNHCPGFRHWEQLATVLEWRHASTASWLVAPKSASGYLYEMSSLEKWKWIVIDIRPDIWTTDSWRMAFQSYINKYIYIYRV